MPTCVTCQTELNVYQKRYCSRKCVGEANAKSLKGNKNSVGHIPWNKGIPSGRGEKNGQWKGGRYSDKRGYVFIKCYDHPRAVRGYIAEHVFIAEAREKRYLVPGEEVHHINGIKNDNRPENLVVLTKIEHLKEHPRARNPKGQFGN